MLEYETGSKMLKAIAEPIRLQILNILSNGERCACDILQQLVISQPTLSHHMKALTASGWVKVRKRATWMHYSINEDMVEQLHQYLTDLTAPRTDSPTRISCIPCCCPPEKSSKPREKKSGQQATTGNRISKSFDRR